METLNYNGHTIDIQQDADPVSPREDDNLGTMICFHRRYALGDKHNMSYEDAIKLEKSEDVISLPLYLYDHSGITMNTTGFSCPWDSGKVGFIYVTLEKVRQEYGKKRITRQFRQKVMEYLKGEVESYDQYLRGDIYGYIVDKDEKDEESCWGFYGEEAALEEAKTVVNCIVKNAA
jgi:hypothetical protein